ncbi:ParA family protein [Oerskovia sp. Sa1BUA8]|uniref:ParA family protein n=1 Tax=Oerskovia douganii TaxID=2762210 RepID=A0A9D5Z0G3_9CELL|nr:ParA family protein [Oerskovia douganii]MBE7702175.1 ParA family protein [Oerskovia douganii]
MARRFAYDTAYLIDADATNDSATVWAKLAADDWPQNLKVARWQHDSGERLADFVKRTVPNDARLVIDTGPHAQDALADAMRSADRFIIPLRPSMMEVVSLYPTLQIAAAVHDERPFELSVLFTQVLGRTRIRREVRENIEEQGIPVLKTEVPSAIAYNESFGTVPRSLGVFPNLLQEIIDTEGDTK